MAIRRCNICGKAMTAGFCVNDGEEYYCSEECLHEVYTEADYLTMYGEDDAYYTEWTDETEETPPTLRVCFKAAGQPVEVREILNSIGALQSLVGGYFEIGRYLRGGIAVLCDEEGLLRQRRYNCLGLVGPLVFIGVGEDDFCSLTDEQIAIILEEGECW